MVKHNVGSKTARQTERLPLDPNEKDTYLGVIHGVEEKTSTAKGTAFFSLQISLYLEDGTPALKKDGSGEAVSLSYNTASHWPNWDAVMSAFFPELDDGGGEIDLPDDFYERWAMVKIGVEEQKPGSKFPPRLEIKGTDLLSGDYVDVIEKISTEENGRESATVKFLRGSKAKAAPKPAAKPAPKPAAAAANGQAKPATQTKQAAPAGKPAAKPATTSKPAPKPAAAAAATATAEVDPENPFGEG
jgi:hypothetical protein